MYGSLTRNSGILGLPIHPSITLPGPISVSPSLQRGFYLALVSAMSGMTLVLFWDAYHHMM